jgi:hypothetical protein
MLTAAAYWIVASHWHRPIQSRIRKTFQPSRIGYSPGLASWRNGKGSDERNAAAALRRRRKQEIKLHW